MAFLEPVGDLHRPCSFAARRQRSRFEKIVGRATECRNNDKWLSGKPLADDVGRAVNRGGILDRGAAELHDNHGRSVEPIRYLSTNLAACRPSRIAHTIRDWPRAISPAAKMPGTFVIFSALVNAELFQHPLPVRAEEAHCEKHEIGINREFGAWNFAHVAAFEFNAAAVELFDVPVAAGKALRQDTVVAIAALFVSRRRAEYIRPVRPRIVHGPLGGWSGKKLELDDRPATLTVDGAEAIRSGVAAAYDDDAFVLR